MTRKTDLRVLAFAGAALMFALPGTALAQEPFDLAWHTIDCGGGPTAADEWSLEATIAQPDAGNMWGPENLDDWSLIGGFWPGIEGVRCVANCDGSTVAPLLNVLDFSCFLNKFAAGDPYANCDHSTIPPVLNVLDFSCYLNAFAAGCS